MTLLAVLLAVAAVLLAVLPPPAAGLRHRLPEQQTAASGVRRRWWRPVAWVAGVAAVLALGLVGAGPRGLTFAAAGAVVFATAARLLSLRSRRAAALRSGTAVAEAAAVLAANLRVGMVPAQALGTAAASCPVLADATATVAIGGDPSPVWRRQADEAGCGGLRDLARAWEVAQTSGASLTNTLEQVAAGLAADQALASVVGSELAAPRATSKLMAALPALGIGMGYLIGGDPLHWLAAGPAGWACLLAGVVLACAGVLWIESLARYASAQV